MHVLLYFSRSHCPLPPQLLPLSICLFRHDLAQGERNLLPRLFPDLLTVLRNFCGTACFNFWHLRLRSLVGGKRINASDRGLQPHRGLFFAPLVTCFRFLMSKQSFRETGCRLYRHPSAISRYARRTASVMCHMNCILQETQGADNGGRLANMADEGSKGGTALSLSVDYSSCCWPRTEHFTRFVDVAMIRAESKKHEWNKGDR